MRLCALFLLCSLLWGCATFRPEPLSPAETVSAFEKRELDSPDLRKFLEQNLGHEVSPWPPETWDFAMLTLAALYYHPDMDVARAKWSVAQAGLITAGQRPNPSTGFTAEHHSMTTGGLSPWTLTSVFDLPVETAGKRGYRIERAGHLSEAARLDIMVAAWQVRSRLRKALLSLFQTDRTGRILAKETALREKIAVALERRLASGEGSRFDVTGARVSLEKSRLSVAESQRKAAAAHAALAEAVGIKADAFGKTPVSFSLFDCLPALPRRENIRHALLNRPDILAALSDYEAAQSLLRLEIAKQYPDIHLGPGYSWDQGDHRWALGFSLTLPVFNRNEGPIAEAEARRKEKAAHFMALQIRVVGEIDGAIENYGKARRELAAADALVSVEAKRLEQSGFLFRQGETDRLALWDSELEYTSAKLLRLEALVTAQRSLGRLEETLFFSLDDVPCTGRAEAED